MERPGRSGQAPVATACFATSASAGATVNAGAQDRVGPERVVKVVVLQIAPARGWVRPGVDDGADGPDWREEARSAAPADRGVQRDHREANDDALHDPFLEPAERSDEVEHGQ